MLSVLQHNVCFWNLSEMTLTTDDNQVKDSINLIKNNNNDNNNNVWSVPCLRRPLVNLQLSEQLISG